MGIDLHKIITHFDEVKIEIGAFGGRTLIYDKSRFKMNDLVKRLVREKTPITHTALKKIEKLNHALPEKLNWIQKILTAVRQFFGNLSYNRDKELFSLALLHKEFSPDSSIRLKNVLKENIPLDKLNEPDHKHSTKPATPAKTISFSDEKKPSARKEPPEQAAKPKLSRSRSFKITDIYQTLREKGEIDDMALVSFAKDIESTLSVPDADYFFKLNSVIQKICGEPLIKFINNEKVEAAFKKPESIKILQYALIRLFSTDKLNFVSKSRMIEQLAPYFPADLLKAFFEAYIDYIKNEKNYYPDKMDDTFKHLMIRYTALSKENAENYAIFKKEDIALGIGCTLLKDAKEAGWLEELVDRYKNDKDLLTHLDAFLKLRLKETERRVCRDKVVSFLENMK